MKKLVFIMAVVTVFSVSGVKAQSTSFGVKGGVNLASLTGDGVETKTRTSFHVGGVAEIMFSDKFSLQPEVLYSSQGYKEEDADIQLKSGYLNVPLMGKFYVVKGFSIQAGPQVGFLMSARVKGEILGVEIDEDVKEDYKDIDYGVNFGLGYKMPSGLFFDARYNLGLSSIDTGESDIKNAVIQFSLGFLF